MDIIPDVHFMIGFDNTQKSVFRYTDKQVKFIQELSKNNRVSGLFVIDNKDTIQHVARNIKKIVNLIGCYPRIEYNVFNTKDINEVPSILEELRQQL